MKLLIAAATGGIGRLILEQAVASGHEVTALVRDPAKLPAGTKAVACDLMNPDPAAVAAAVDGAEAVLSGLGATGKGGVGVAAKGTRALIQAMRPATAKRLVVVSAGPIGTVASAARPRPPKHDPGDGFAVRYLLGPIIKRVFAEHYADLAEMEDAVRDSGLEWTIVRPPRLLDGPASGNYRTAVDRNVRGGTKVTRADVAQLMLSALTDPATIGHSVAVAK